MERLLWTQIHTWAPSQKVRVSKRRRHEWNGKDNIRCGWYYTTWLRNVVWKNIPKVKDTSEFYQRVKRKLMKTPESTPILKKCTIKIHTRKTKFRLKLKTSLINVYFVLTQSINFKTNFRDFNPIRKSSLVSNFLFFFNHWNPYAESW